MRALIYFFFAIAVTGFAVERKCSYPLIRKKECRIHGCDTSVFSTYSKDEETPIQVRCTSFRLPLDKKLNSMYRRRKFVPGRTKVSLEDGSELLFEYEYNQLNIEAKDKAEDTPIKAIILIQPIGVGIGRWYYDRLLQEFQKSQKDYKSEVIIIATDLLGCGTACSPMMVSSQNDAPRILEQLPLLQVQDWSSQIIDLMQKIEFENPSNDVEFCIISNGGCVPIALDVVDKLRYEKNQLKGKLTHLIFSATPSITSLLKPKDYEKVAKSYRTLSGTVGNLFWWYALRKEGKFLQTFSEKNLASKPENLGDKWRPQCFQTARANKGKSRFSTFAFLAGALNGGCADILEELKSQNEIKVDIITGGDKRENKARSWFWQRAPKVKKMQDEDTLDEGKEKTTLVTYFNDNNSSFVQEIFTAGRRCPAHEDPEGFITAIESLVLQE